MRSRYVTLFVLACLLITALPSLTAAASFTSSAGAAPATVAPGSPVALTAEVTSSSTTTLLVDLEVFRADGQRVFQKWWDNQAFVQGQPRTLQATWDVPADAAPGAYTLKIGLFSPGWGTLYHWNNGAGQLALAADAPSAPGANGLSATYFSRRNLSVPVVTRTDPNVAFSWGSGSPDGRIGADNFSVRWKGQVQPRFTETYAFYTTSDDGVRLWVDGRQIISNWTRHPAVEDVGTITLEANKTYDIVLEYFEATGEAQITLAWSSPSQAKQTIPTNRLFLPAVGVPPPATATPAPPPATATPVPPPATATPVPPPATATPVPPPATATPVPPPATATPVSPGEGRYFGTLPPGSQLPSDAECAAAVKRRPENKGRNAAYNATRGSQQLPSSFNPYGPRVTGNFTGTTDEILQWAACKWGIDEDMVRAQAAIESWWHQDTLGDWTTDPSRCAPGRGLGVDGRPGQCPESFGILQNRYPYEQAAWPGFADSTAFNADLTYAIWRGCYEGYETWLNDVERGRQYAAGDAWGCFGRWFSGRWYTQPAQDYMGRVRAYLDDRIWEQPYFQEP